MAIDSKHLTERTRRPGEGWLRALAAACLLYSGCNDAVDSRQRAGAELSEIRFGVDGRLGLRVQPSVIDEATVDDYTGRAVAQVWCSAPFVDIEVDNGVFGATTFDLRLLNVDGRATFDAVVGPLPAGVRRDSRCVTESFLAQPELVVAPIAPSERLRTVAEVSVAVPACSTLRIRTRPSETTTRYRLVVAGEVFGDSVALQRAVRAAIDAQADHLHVLGGVLIDENPSALRSSVSDELTFSYSMGETEARGAWDAVHAAHGPSNWVARVGRVRLLNLDTAGGGLVDEQWGVVDTLDSEILGGPSLALMKVPPVDAAGANERSFRSYVQAGRLLELLQRTRTRLLLSSSPERSERSDFALMELVNVADGRARESERRLALVDLFQPATVLLGCDEDVDCRVGESCVEDVCLTSCETDAACPPARPVCGGQSSERGCRIGCATDDDCLANGGSCLVESGFCTESARYSWQWLTY